MQNSQLYMLIRKIVNYSINSYSQPNINKFTAESANYLCSRLNMHNLSVDQKGLTLFLLKKEFALNNFNNAYTEELYHK